MGLSDTLNMNNIKFACLKMSHSFLLIVPKFLDPLLVLGCAQISLLENLFDLLFLFHLLEYF